MPNLRQKHRSMWKKHVSHKSDFNTEVQSILCSNCVCFKSFVYLKFYFTRISGHGHHSICSLTQINIIAIKLPANDPISDDLSNLRKLELFQGSGISIWCRLKWVTTLMMEISLISNSQVSPALIINNVSEYTIQSGCLATGFTTTSSHTNKQWWQYVQRMCWSISFLFIDEVSCLVFSIDTHLPLDVRAACRANI